MGNSIQKLAGALLAISLVACANAQEDTSADEQGVLALLAIQGMDTEGDSAVEAALEGVYAHASGLSSSSLVSYWGSSSGSDNGECNKLLGCTKGNYNINWKQSQCNSGRTPGDGARRYYRGHITANGKKWDKGGTNQDHQGVCVRQKNRVGAPNYVFFHDGCTGYPGGNPPRYNNQSAGIDHNNWGKVFHGACVMHDLCYQNEPNYSGRSKGYCDNVMYNEARAICYRAYKNTYKKIWRIRIRVSNELDKCLNKANTARLGLLLGSKKHYDKYNFGQPWRKHQICAPGRSYDVLQRKCR